MSFLLVFISPILYIFLSAAVLSNFKVPSLIPPPTSHTLALLPGFPSPPPPPLLFLQIAYHFLARASYQRSGNAVWQAVQPILAKQMEFLEQVFGPPATFTPSVTHVMLVRVVCGGWGRDLH